MILEVKGAGKKYYTYNLDVAMVRSSLNIWRHYLYGFPCEVLMNHHSLILFVYINGFELEVA